VYKHCLLLIYADDLTMRLTTRATVDVRSRHRSNDPGNPDPLCLIWIEVAFTNRGDHKLLTYIDF